MNNVDWTPIFQAVIALLSAVITGLLIPWIRSKCKVAKLDNLNMYLRVLMSAAETYFGSQMGQEKKQFVLDELKRNGIYFDEETVQDALEAMWRELCAEGILNTEEHYPTDEELEEE